MQSSGTSLQLDRVRRVFGVAPKNSGVEEVSLEIPLGEGFSLLGPSGCGKTTTLRMIGGFEKPQSGRIRLEGRDITDLPPQSRDIRTVFQRYALFPHLSVFENIVFGLRMQRRPEAEIRSKASKIIELIEIAHIVDRKVQQLSGGEQQRVALARALITEPKILLLDEPLSALDLKLRERMQLELLGLRKKLGMTFIFVTHDQTEAMVLSDRIGVMSRGRLQQTGTPEEIYAKPVNRFVASFIGQANFIGPEHVSLLRGEIATVPEIPQGKDWMLRPESMIVRRKGTRLASGFVGIPGRVSEMAFLGQNRLAKVIDPLKRQHLIKLPGGELPGVHENDEVTLAWRMSDSWLVESDSDVVS